MKKNIYSTVHTYCLSNNMKIYTISKKKIKEKQNLKTLNDFLSLKMMSFSPKNGCNDLCVSC
jgi:hypothetical protein